MKLGKSEKHYTVNKKKFCSKCGWRIATKYKNTEYIYSNDGLKICGRCH